MKKTILLWAALLSSASCSLIETGALNPRFLDPVHDRLFKNEFQVNDFQYLFDASNQTVSIKTRRSSETVDGIYSLELVGNPAANQGIYRMKGSKSYDNFFIGLEYTSRGNNEFGAKIVIQNTEFKVRDALNTWNTNAFVTAPIFSYPYFKMSSAGTWARVSSSGIYNSSITEHYTFIYNELVDRGDVNESHLVKVSSISGFVTNTEYYTATLATNISSSSAVFYIISTNAPNRPNGLLHSFYLGFEIINSDIGVPRAKIITSSGAVSPAEDVQGRFVTTLKNSAVIDFTTLNSVERPDSQLLPLRTKGPWVFIPSNNAFDSLNTTNWDFSTQDQSVTVTIHASGTQSTGVYSLKAAGISSVFQLSNISGLNVFPNKYFGFKFREPPGVGHERGSFYIEDSAEAAAQKISSPSFSDNYVNIYKAGTLISAVNYKIQPGADQLVLPSVTSYLNKQGIGASLFGAVVFTREDERRTEYIYVVGGANDPRILTSLAGTTDGLYELHVPPKNLRKAVARTVSLGQDIAGASGWENIPFDVTGYLGPSDIVAPFDGQYAWVGSRLFIYNPAKYGDIITDVLGSSPFKDVPDSYRLISTTTFSSEKWAMASLPSALTNRVHASFFSSQGVLTIIAGLSFIENSHTTPIAPAVTAPVGGLYTMTNDIWQSYNGGTTWARVGIAAFSPRYMATALNVGSDIFLLGGYTANVAGGGSFSDEIWRSSDNGITWTKVAGVLPAAVASSYVRRDLGRMRGFVINNTMYITTVPALNGNPALYSSKDGGVSWQQEADLDKGVAALRSSSAYSASYAWSANNTAHKGVLFIIGGFDNLASPSVNTEFYLRTLRP